MHRFTIFTKFQYWLLALVILVSFGIRVYNLNYNSPFLDEALYLRLGEQVLSWQWQQADPYSWVGGMPLFYPTLSAIFGQVGGIIGSRFLSVLLGTGSVYLIFLFAKNLSLGISVKQNIIIGIVSSALLGVLAMPVFLSRWAIYDMLSFTIFLLGLVLLQRAQQIKKLTMWQLEGRLMFAALVFFLSFLAKYITLILFPFVIAWALYIGKKQSSEIFKTTGGYFALPLIAGLTWYIIQNFTHLLHFQQEQVSTVAYGAKQIFSRFLQYTSFIIPAALLGSIMLATNRKKWMTVVFLLVSASIVPVVHMVTNNYASVHQHTFLSMIFLIPLVSYVLANIITRQVYVGSILSIILVLGMFFYSQTQVASLESSWANSNQAMSYINNNTTSHEKVLSSEDDVTVVSLNNIKSENITGIYNFAYQSDTSESAYSKALRDGYFDVVLINQEMGMSVTDTIKSSLTSHYTPVYSDTPFIVFKKSGI